MNLVTGEKPPCLLLRHHLFVLFSDSRRRATRIDLCSHKHLLDSKDIQRWHIGRKHYHHLMLHGIFHCRKYRYWHQGVRYHCTRISWTIHGCLRKDSNHYWSLELRLGFLVLFRLLRWNHYLHHSWDHCRHQGALHCQFHHYCWHVQTDWPLFLYGVGPFPSHRHVHENPTEVRLWSDVERSLRPDLRRSKRCYWHVICFDCLQRWWVQSETAIDHLIWHGW